ncbi:MAG: dual specificity protein phosphatase [Chloroflexota bacterium]
MYKIRDWLYISNYPTAKVPQTLKQYGIQAMIQLYQPIQVEGIESKFVRMLDGIPIMPSYLQESITFIREQNRKKHRLLSTCGAGISRSVTMAIVALKEVEGLTMFEAYHSIYQYHPTAMPDHVHWQSVANYYGEDADFWTVWADISLLDNN